jgi:hypothetical protein
MVESVFVVVRGGWSWWWERAVLSPLRLGVCVWLAHEATLLFRPINFCVWVATRQWFYPLRKLHVHSVSSVLTNGLLSLKAGLPKNNLGTVS